MKPMKSKPAIRTLLLSSGLLASLNIAHAADIFWDGTTTTADADGGDGTWDNGTTLNWDTLATGGADSVWTNANTAIFGGTAGTVTLGDNITVAGIEFSSGGYTIDGGGNTITLANSGGKRTTKSPAATLHTPSGTTTINANIDTNGFRFTTVGSGAALLTGDISGSGGFATYNNSNVTLSGANTYTGKTDITSDTTSGSILRVSSLNSVNGGTPLMASSSLGAPTTIANGTILIGNSGKRASNSLIYEGAAATGETTDRVVRLEFNGSSQQSIYASGSGLLKFTSAMTSNAGSQSGSLNLRGTGGGEIVQDLPVLATGGLRKFDSGTWTVAGGAVNRTRVEGGTLIVNGTLTTMTTVDVSNGATLGGTGTLSGTATINSGGTLSPGASPGTLTFSDDLTMLNGSTYAFEGGDLVDVDGNLTLTDNWTLALGGGLQDGGSVTLFEYGTLTGGFDDTPTFDLAGLGFAPTSTLTLTDDGGFITLNGLSVVPEPSTTALLGLGGLALILRRRK